jgi:excisionase family DNA binding protein
MASKGLRVAAEGIFSLPPHRTMGEGRTDEPRRDKRLTVQQAAARLGISEGAVRNRIKRGTLRADRVAGRVYVLLSGAASRDESIDESLLVAVLREQLAAERQAHAEARRIIAGLVERIPAIEAPSETSEAHEAAEEQQGRVEGPTPLREGLRRARRGRGGGEYSDR